MDEYLSNEKIMCNTYASQSQWLINIVKLSVNMRRAKESQVIK